MINKEVTDFRQYLVDRILNKEDRILEFGPLTRPIVTKDKFPNSFYADIRSTEEVKKLYLDNLYLKSTGLRVNLDAIVDIDYIIRDSYKKTFKKVRKFDVAILSHVVEHMPDIINFFQDILNVLKEDGRLVLIYPDADYCFDHFRNGSSFADAYEVYANGKNLSNRVMDFVYNVIPENNPVFFWNDKKENTKLPKNDFKQTLEIYNRSLDGEYPDDVHFWPFSNHQLIKFFYDMDRAGLFKFEIEGFFPTSKNTQECMVILKVKQTKKLDYNKYIKLLDCTSKSQMRMDCYQIKDDFNELLSERDALLAELESIRNNKRWRYISKLSHIKNKLLRRE